MRALELETIIPVQFRSDLRENLAARHKLTNSKAGRLGKRRDFAAHAQLAIAEGPDDIARLRDAIVEKPSGRRINRGFEANQLLARISDLISDRDSQCPGK